MNNCGLANTWANNDWKLILYLHNFTVYPDPWITCPDNVIITLSPGANTADVSALLGSPNSNQPAERITITPAQYSSNKIFPAGTTTLTYTATNQNGKTAQCNVGVIVQGKCLPCEGDKKYLIYEWWAAMQIKCLGTKEFLRKKRCQSPQDFFLYTDMTAGLLFCTQKGPARRRVKINKKIPCCRAPVQ